MKSSQKCQKCLNIMLFIIFFQSINSQSFSYGMNYVKAFKLHNGNIMISGDNGINTYDSTGLIPLYNCSLLEIINSEENSKYRAFAQFSEENNSVVIFIVLNVIYIFNNDGNYIFKDRIDIPFSFTRDNYYTIVPHIYKEGKYYFILGYKNEQKPYLQYISFDLTKRNFTFEDEYLFEDSECNDGLSCQLMDYKNNEVLTCFFLNNYPPGVYSYSFQLNNSKIESLDLYASYSDKTFVVQSVVSEDRKKSLICYIRNDETASARYGYCNVYDIESNSFLNLNISSLQQLYGTSVNNIYLNYYKETKEYVFAFTGYTEGITFMKFNENFEIVKLKCGDEIQDSCHISLSSTCQSVHTFSIIPISKQYIVIGHQSCNGEERANLNPLSDEFNPVNNSPESSINDNSDTTDSHGKPSNLVSTYLDKTTILSNQNSINDRTIISTLISTLPTNIKTSLYKSSGTTKPDLGTTFPMETTTTSLSNETISTSISISKTTLISTNLNMNTSDNYPSKTIICTGYRDTKGTICFDVIPTGYYLLDDLNNIIEKCYFNCESCMKRPEENNITCMSCKENFELNQDYNCLYKYNFYYDNEINETVYLTKNQLCPENYPYETVKTKECVESCEIEEFINKLCIISNYTKNNIKQITEQFKTIINDVNDSDYDVIIDGNNIIYEITTTSAKTDHHNVSLIDFGECEKILKSRYSIDYLLVFKVDIKKNDSCPLAVEYEVYSPKTKEQLNISLCENKNIDIYVPISIDNQTNSLYESMSQYGIDILDANNSFYNDICMPFTTDDGTDITLSDRQSTYYNGDIALCETDCEYISYNSTNRKAKCKCKIKKRISEMTVISYDKIGVDEFLDFKTISNIDIIKCHKLTFSLSGLSNNYGTIILGVLILFFIITFIIYLFTQKNTVSRIIRIAFNYTNLYNPPKKPMSHHKIKSEKNVNSSSKQQSKTIRDLIDNNNLLINKDKKKKSKKIVIKNYHNINVIKKANIIIDCDKHEKPYHKKHTKKNKSSLKGKKTYNINKTKNLCKKMTQKSLKLLKYNEQELNSLPYKKVVLVDKRTYCQYYWSLIKYKHILLFIFMPSNDYNLITVKIGLFIFYFCLNFTVNAFFFTDETMHKIYKDKGMFNILIQLPSIFYSNLISTVINILMKTLALSDKVVLQHRHAYDKNIPKEKTVNLYKKLILKYNIFYFISFVLLIFFWYYISTFCAVYKNTQIALISSTLSSFSFSLTYPFGLNLLSGIFRIPALKSKEKNKECLYTFGNVLALI